VERQWVTVYGCRFTVGLNSGRSRLKKHRVEGIIAGKDQELWKAACGFQADYMNRKLLTDNRKLFF
jgi:hypothetical protein